MSSKMAKKYDNIKQKLNKLEHTQTSNHKHVKTFFPRVVNNMKFITEELNLLNKGLKYNLSHKNKNWFQTLAMETETAVAQVPTQEHECIRARAAYNLKQLYRKQTAHTHQNFNQAKKENHTLNQIKEKLESNMARISKADKGYSIVITYNKDYNDRTELHSKQQFHISDQKPDNNVSEQDENHIKELS
jgi:hypothetical protein